MKFKIIISLLVSSLFWVSQSNFAATYIEPSANSHGLLRFDNVLLESSTTHVSAQLVANDSSRLHGGQVFSVDTKQLGEVLGEQDAAYSDLTQKITSKNIFETSTLTHDITLLLTGFDNTKPNNIQFTVTELHSKVLGSDEEILKEVIFIQGVQGQQGEIGETGPQGEKGDIGIQGLTGAVGSQGLQGIQGDPGIDGVDGTSIVDGTNDLDLLTWEGGNWVAKPPVDQVTGQDKMQPFLTMNYIIALQGIFPSRNAADPYIAEVILFAGNFAPRGWAFCDGQLLTISSNQALFSLIGTIYGGDGRTTFALPDLRGRVPLHAGNGPGLSDRSLGRKGGSETH